MTPTPSPNKIWTGQDLWVYRGGRAVLKGLSLEWLAGERILLTGSNGAGKSTLIQVMAGALESLRGTIHLQGEKASRHSWMSFRKGLGFLADRPPLCPGLTLLETLKFWLEISGLTPKDKELKDALAWAGLGDLGGRRCTQLSKGQGQRLGLALLRLRKPSWVLLDEPQSGLDAAGQNLLSELLVFLGQASVVLCSHQEPPEEIQWHRRLSLHQGLLR